MKRYISPLTKELTPDNWKDKIDLKAMTMDDMVDLLGDLRSMKSFSTKLEGYMKEVVHGRRGDKTEFQSRNFKVQVNHVERKGGLDEEAITKEMGEEWVEGYRKDKIEYDEIKLSRIKE